MRHVEAAPPLERLLSRHLDDRRRTAAERVHLERELAVHWARHVRSSHDVTRAVQRVPSLVAKVRALADEVNGLRPLFDGSVDRLARACKAPDHRARRLLAQLHVGSTELAAASRLVNFWPHGIDWHEQERRLHACARGVRRVLEEHIVRACSVAEQCDAVGASAAALGVSDLPIDTSDWDPELFGGMPAGEVVTLWLQIAELSGVIGLVFLGNLSGFALAFLFWTAVFLALLVVYLVVELIDALEEWFNGEDDDRARLAIATADCSAIENLPADEVVRMLEALLDGPTGDDDERAILKLLRCLPPDRVRSEVWPRFGTSIRDNVDGEEYDRLLGILVDIGVLSVREWDDDATRDYVFHATSAEITRFGLVEIQRMILNLFDGATGDDDEAAINRIVSALSCEQLAALLALRGTHYSDFADEMNGEEWDRFNRILRSCGLP